MVENPELYRDRRPEADHLTEQLAPDLERALNEDRTVDGKRPKVKKGGDLGPFDEWFGPKKK